MIHVSDTNSNQMVLAEIHIQTFRGRILFQRTDSCKSGHQWSFWLMQFHSVPVANWDGATTELSKTTEKAKHSERYVLKAKIRTITRSNYNVSLKHCMKSLVAGEKDRQTSERHCSDTCSQMEPKELLSFPRRTFLFRDIWGEEVTVQITTSPIYQIED